MSADVTARVTRGMAELDRAVPDWLDRINLDELDLTSGVYRPRAYDFSNCGCILAQLAERKAYAGFYEDAALDLFGKDPSNDLDWLIDHGFTLPRWKNGGSVEGPWAELEQAWRDAITARRAAS